MQREINIFLSDGSEYLCPVCKEGSLIFRDYCKRNVRQDDGEREKYYIPRHKCNNPRCGKVHRMLPDFMVPFKHYSEDVISDCVNTSSEQSQICGGPSASTIDRWKRWMELNKPDIDGQLKSIGHRELGFSKELINWQTMRQINQGTIC